MQLTVTQDDADRIVAIRVRMDGSRVRGTGRNVWQACVQRPDSISRRLHGAPGTRRGILRMPHARRFPARDSSEIRSAGPRLSSCVSARTVRPAPICGERDGPSQVLIPQVKSIGLFRRHGPLSRLESCSRHRRPRLAVVHARLPRSVPPDISRIGVDRWTATVVDVPMVFVGGQLGWMGNGDSSRYALHRSSACWCGKCSGTA